MPKGGGGLRTLCRTSITDFSYGRMTKKRVTAA